MNNEKVKFLLNWNHFAEHLSSCMTRLMTDITFSDIIIATADKHMIYSHRFVLANSSKYFQRLLKQMSRPTGIQLVVALPEIKYEIFKILMNYMYKGETQVPHELLPSVIKAGQFLEINGLVNLNENENSGNNTSLSKCNPGGESQSRSGMYSHKIGGQDGKKHQAAAGHMTSKLRDKTHCRENANNSSPNVFRRERRIRNQSGNESESLEVLGDNGKENRSKVTTKSLRSKTITQEKKEYVIKLPFKRKSSLRDSSKSPSSKRVSPGSTPSSSMPIENENSKKISKKMSPTQEVFPIKIKEEKESESSSSPQSKAQEEENLDDKVTIKEEVPDDVEVVYNELQCEFCHEIYTNPSDWVKHMTQQHEDRGYQTYKDLDKSVGGSAVITCVVCSCVCFSAAEWANHLRVWHSDRELAVANVADSKKTVGKTKKKSSGNKKQQL